MPWNKVRLPIRVWASVADIFRRWWKEASGPIPWHYHRLAWHAVLRRALLWLPVVALVASMVGGAAVWLLIGWRANDLAGKALANVRAGNLPMARLQIMSAANLRPRDPGVRRAHIFVQSKFNDPAALALWEKLAAEVELTPAEIEERARLAARAGSDAQFACAVAALEESGHVEVAAGLRSSRMLQSGNLAAAIDEARTAAGTSGDAERKFDLLTILLLRHVPILNLPGAPPSAERKGAEEIIALVDELQGTPVANRAIGAALGAFPQPADKARAWAEAALSDLSPSNPALLPAVQFMIATGERKPQDYIAPLSAAFAGADDERSALFAQWLNQQRMWDETLSLITAKDAARNSFCFEQRGWALAGREQWTELLAMSEAPSQAPDSLRLIFRGLAAGKLGKIGIAPKSLADAVRAGVREGRLPQTLAVLDSLGEGKVADPLLVEMCASPGLADNMFRVARDRFARRGQFGDLSAAFAAASKAAPDAPPVRDFRWRRRLLAGKAVNPDDTAAAVAASPADPQPRFTHALALLKAGRPADALGVFHDIDIFVERLPPGDKAIVIAIWQANGLDGHARSLRQSLHPDLLQSSEYALINRSPAQNDLAE